MNPIQKALQFLNKNAVQPVEGAVASLTQPQQFQSPLPQGQQLTPKQIYNQQYAQQVKAKGGYIDAQGIAHYDMTGQQPTSNINTTQAPTQAVQGVATKIAQSQPVPATTPTPTPFPENPMNGYVMSTPAEYIPTINAAAQKYKIPTGLLSGLLNAESQWIPDVINGKITSSTGAQGIAQFMPDTAKGMGINPLDPKQAIMAAAKKLRASYDQFGNNSDLALAAYNAGAGNVQKYGGVPPFGETQRYITKIRADQQSLYNPSASK